MTADSRTRNRSCALSIINACRNEVMPRQRQRPGRHSNHAYAACAYQYSHFRFFLSLWQAWQLSAVGISQCVRRLSNQFMLSYNYTVAAGLNQLIGVWLQMQKSEVKNGKLIRKLKTLRATLQLISSISRLHACWNLIYPPPNPLINLCICQTIIWLFAFRKF